MTPDQQIVDFKKIYWDHRESESCVEMTKQEYDDIQLRFNKKIEKSKRNMTGKRQEGFETGVLACKSILSEIYRRQTGTEKRRNENGKTYS